MPKIWDAVRVRVDDQSKNGMYILTGSAVPPKNEMSLFESKESSGAISLSALFVNAHLQQVGDSPLAVEEIAFVLCRGGWPASIGKGEQNALLMGQE